METTNLLDQQRAQPAGGAELNLQLQSNTPSASAQAVGEVWSPGMPGVSSDAAAQAELPGIKRQAWLRKGIPELASPLAG
jgi:hypothetical protein